MSILYQVIATIIVCFPCFNMGIMYAWPSSTILMFTSENTTLQRPMTSLEVSLFGSLSSVGAMISTPITAFLLNKFGRKCCTMLSGLASVVSWATIGCTTSVEVLLFAVFISGFCGASFLIVPVYVSEFCQESIRGTMSSGSMVFYGIGMLFSYIIGGYLGNTLMTYIALTTAAVEVILMTWLKESPVHLMKTGNEEKAMQSIAFYREVKLNSKEVLQEISIIRRALNTKLLETLEHEMLQPTFPEANCVGDKREITINTMGRSSKKQSTLQFFFASRPTKRGLFITLALMTAAIFQGLVAVQVYAEPLFVKAVPVMPSALCSVIFAVCVVIASLTAACMSDIAGRRPLMIYSSIASGFCCILLGTQIQLEWGPNWLTAVIIYAFCVVYSFGGGTVPYVLLAEVFLPEVKSFMTMLVVEWMWVCCSLLLMIFNPLEVAIGLGPVFYIFAAICFLSGIFSIFYVPETKGLALDVIQSLLMHDK
ncbi:hypothetical protein ACJJTC_000775 [Scirpophaga incertulas]